MDRCSLIWYCVSVSQSEKARAWRLLPIPAPPSPSVVAQHVNSHRKLPPWAPPKKHWKHGSTLFNSWTTKEKGPKGPRATPRARVAKGAPHNTSGNFKFNHSLKMINSLKLHSRVYKTKHKVITQHVKPFQHSSHTTDFNQALVQLINQIAKRNKHKL